MEMTKCDRNDVGSLILNRVTTSSATVSSPGGGGGTFRLWTSFSGGAAFRRKIFAAMRCGGGSLHHHHHRRRRSSTDTVEDDDDVNDDVIRTATTKKVVSTAVRPGRSKSIRGSGRSEKLSDLLSMSESSPDASSKETEVESKRKIEALEEMKGVVKLFQCQEMTEQKKKEGAMRVRRLAKEGTEARTMLAMLGAIPPLVGMLDSEDQEVLIESLYALLNLGIANDVCVVLFDL